ncbi:MAG: hypothetical protein AAFS12_07420, partial [Cyanobacteria bacterium J06632_19]
MSNKFTAFLLLLFLAGIGSQTWATASLEQAGCQLRASTLPGTVDGCTNPPGPINFLPYTYTLQKKVGEVFVDVDFSGNVNSSVHFFNNQGPGTYRVEARVWRETGNLLFQNFFLCNEIAESVFLSDELVVSTLGEWVSFPLGGNDNAQQWLDVRNDNPEDTYYFTSGDRMFEYRWVGFWQKTNMVPSVSDVKGPIAAADGFTSNVFYKNSGNSMGRYFQS